MKKNRRAAFRLHSCLFEINPLEPRLLMSTGQLFVGLAGTGPSGSVAEYTGTGATANATLVSSVTNPVAEAVSGTNLFVVNNDNTVSEYTTTGSLVNASFLQLPEVDGIAVSGNDIFISDSASGVIGEYTTSGTTVNASLISDNNQPAALTISGSDLFVVNSANSTVGEYTLAGATVNAALITAGTDPTGLASSGSDLFLADGVSGTVGEYTTAGATVNASLITGLSSPRSLSIYGSNLYLSDVGTNVIGQYTTAGATVNASLISGLASPLSVFAVGPANKLVVHAAPTSATAGTALSPALVIHAEDSNGNVDSLESSNVTVAIASGPAGAVLGGTTTVALQNGTASFSNLTLSKSGTYTLTATDGSFTAAVTSSITVQAGVATQFAFAQSPTGTTVGTAITPAVTVDVEDANGNLVTTDTSNLTISIATGPTGAVLGGTTTVAAVAGVATFSNLTLSNAGTFTLSVSGNYPAITSGSFAISAPATNHLVFSQQPVSTTTTSVLAPVKVSIENASGILQTSDTSGVTVTIVNQSTETTYGSPIRVVASGGIATFSNLTITAPGTYILSAVDDEADPVTTSNSFTISAAGVNRLAFATQPQSATTSATLPAVRVNVQNSSGSLLTGDTSTVTLAIASGPAGAALGGTTSVAAVAGVATFSNLSFSTAGTYTLVATDAGDTSATSLSFTISPPQANKLAFASQPVSGSTTTAITSSGMGTIRVDVENSAGTLLSGDSSSVTLTIAGGTAGATLGGTTTVAAVNGVATFSNLFITTAGTNYTLTASDGTDVPATSSAFSITAPPTIDSLAFAAEPVNTTITETLGSVTVDIKDSTGAVVTTDTGNVTLSITGNPAGATLGGTTTVAAVNGVATFSNLMINTVGSYTLMATESGRTAAASTAFNVYYPAVTVGQLDPVFGSAGLVKSNVGFTSTAGVANDNQQGNGQVVAIGSTGAVPTESFAVARYNADGTLDNTFGSSGVATVHFAGTDDVPAAVAVLANGQILIAGTATTYVSGSPTTSQFAVAELNANGTLNTNFGNGTGEVLFGFSSAATHDVLTAMVVSPAGVIYLGGRSDSRSTTGNDFAIVALNPAGAPDSSFGSGGQLLIDFDNASDTINSLALQTNGDLVTAGSAVVGGTTEIALARVLPTGALDRHFGTNGLVTTSVRGIFDSATSVAIQPRGQIVIGGLSAAVTAVDSTTDFVVARYTSGGKLDRSFGSGGVVLTSFSGPSAVTQVLIQADGRIVATGKFATSLTSIDSNPLDVALARYTTRGVLDTAFGGSGTAVVDPTTATFTTSEAHAITSVGATTLATEAEQLIASRQGSAVLNANAEILAVGNAGENTVEAEVITRGVDLAATVLTPPPAAIAGGTRTFANVQISEIAPDTAKGSITLTLELTTDAQGNGATVLKTFTQKINLAGGHNHVYKIPFTYPANLPTGNYYLQASVIGDGTAPMRELNQLNNLSPAGHTVTITPPFIPLVGSALSATSTFTSGKPARVQFTLTNTGNVLARGKTMVDLYLSKDQTAADGTLVSDKPFAIALQPGASHAYRQVFVLPKTLASGTYTLIAVVDPDKSLGAIDQTDSTVIDPTRLTIG
jgi:uncharacterized delta-60 repeat protein